MRANEQRNRQSFASDLTVVQDELLARRQSTDSLLERNMSTADASTAARLARARALLGLLSDRFHGGHERETSRGRSSGQGPQSIISVSDDEGSPARRSRSRSRMRANEQRNRQSFASDLTVVQDELLARRLRFEELTAQSRRRAESVRTVEELLRLVVLLRRSAEARRQIAVTQSALQRNTATVKHRSSQSDEGENESQQECSICLEQFQEDEELRLLPCFHKYHTACIDRWFQHSPACPICKNSIIGQPAEGE